MIGWSSREWERWDAREGEDIEKCTTSLRSYLSSDSHRDTAGDQPSAFNICKYLFGPKSSLPWKQLINQAAWVYFSCQGTFQGLITLLFYYEKEEREREQGVREVTGDSELKAGRLVCQVEELLFILSQNRRWKLEPVPARSLTHTGTIPKLEFQII